MADYWTQGAFAFRCTQVERALLAEAFAAARALREGVVPEPSPALLAAFPPHDGADRLSGFRALFPDPDFPHFGASFIPDDVPDDPALAEVAIFGDSDFEPQAIAAVIQRCCPATLAGAGIGFEWADSCSAPRVDSFGGGWCAIFADRIAFETTGEGLARALNGGID